MIGITSINGFPLPMEKRMAKIRTAGFASIMLWWGPDEAESRRKRVDAAVSEGLHIENAHASTDQLNMLWVEGTEGDDTLDELIREIDDCACLGVGTLVMHLTNGSAPPPVSAAGMRRMETLIRCAEYGKVHLAVENVRLPNHVRFLLDQCDSPYVGLCWDSGHEHFWTPDTDWLDLYGNRVFAVHLHDNRSDADSHLVPFDGIIDWERKAAQIARSSYTGSITMESEMHASRLYEADGFDAFLTHAYLRGQQLESMIRAFR